MKRENLFSRPIIVIIFLLLFFPWSAFSFSESSTDGKSRTQNTAIKLAVPPNDKIYHASFPDFGGWEDSVSEQRVFEFDRLAGKKTSWSYLSNNWWLPRPGIHFPKEAVNTIYHGTGRIPFIRMMPRNEDPETGDIMLPDRTYTMQAFIDGKFDEQLRQWAIDAKATAIPLLVEFGTECNGYWFPWNAAYNGKDTRSEYGDPMLFDGMERFRDAYRHIIDLFNSLDVNNITWFFHIDAFNDPDHAWNTMAGYYPGDDYIDWIGVSVYGPQQPQEGWWSFTEALNTNWDEIQSISQGGKPIAILEWGVIDYPSLGPKGKWIADAIDAITPGGRYYPKIKAISYWHENFDETNLRLDSSIASLDAYRSGIADPTFVSTAHFAIPSVKKVSGLRVKVLH